MFINLINLPNLPVHDAFIEIVVLLLAAAIVGVISLRLRQPLIIGFIAVGLLVGPSGLKWIQSTEQIRVFAEMGLALLLFVVGLKLDLGLIRKMGKVSLATGLGQMAFSTVVGFGLTLLLGMPPVMAIYVAVAVIFSSTILIVKLLSDKRETDSLHGRIALGFLIVEDIVVVLGMIVLAAFTGKATLPLGWQLLLFLGKGAGLFLAVWLVNTLIFPRLLPLVARSTELLVLFGITWALVLAGAGDLLGFSKEVGAFVAGVSLASTMYRDILGTKLASLRDFLLLFFFLELGSHLTIGSLGAHALIAIPLVLLVMFGKPFIVMAIMGRMGYTKRTGFMAGLTVAQVSEFSLILIAMGEEVGHVGSDAVTIVTLVLVATMAISSHLITHAQGIYERLAPYLNIFERRQASQEDADRQQIAQAEAGTVILIGLGNYGGQIGERLLERGRAVLGVDFDPVAVERWRARGQPAVFGDASDPDFAHALALSSAQWVISSLRDPRVNAAIVQGLHHEGYHGLIGLAVENRAAMPSELMERTDLLFVPFEDAAEQAVDLVTNLEEELAKKSMERHIESLSGHYIICGYGRMGQQIARDFQRQQVAFVVVEDNPQQLPRLQTERVPHVIGPASQDEVLRKAGIERAHGLIAVAPTDEENVFIVLSARGLNPGLNIVARSIREENEDKLRRAGADRVMSPYILGGRRMAAAATRPGVMDFLDLVLHSDAIATELGHITVPPGAFCVGQTIRQLALWQACGVTVLAVQRGADLHANPGPDFLLQEGDELILMGTQEQIDNAQTYLSRTSTAKGPASAAPAR